MRVFLVAATAALAAATPATLAAQEAVPDEGEMSEDALSTLSEKLEDPAEQERLATMMGAMGEALMALPVGPMMQAMERATGEDAPDVAPDTTLGELAGPDAERLPGEIAEKLPEMMGMMAGMADTFEAMVPMMEAMAETMRAQIEHGGS